MKMKWKCASRRRLRTLSALSALILAVSVLSMAGCSGSPAASGETTGRGGEWKTEDRAFGSYELPASWGKIQGVGDPGLWIYSSRGANPNVVQSHVYVKREDQELSAEDTEAFLALIEDKLDGIEVKSYETAGGYTAANYQDSKTFDNGQSGDYVEYCILGEGQIVRISAWDYHDKVKPSSLAVAKEMAESFRWKERAEDNQSDFTLEQNEIGTYKIPVDWVRVDELSAGGQPVYLQKGADPDVPQSNVSILGIETPFEPREKEAFIADIALQLQAQMGVNNAEVEDVDNERYTVIKFTFPLPTPTGQEATQTLYYILLKKKAVQISAIDLYDGVTPDVHTVALKIIDSITWQRPD